MNAPANIDSPMLAIRKSYKAPPSAVFAAFTQADALGQWFSPHGGDCKVEIDLQVGGKWSALMTMMDGETAEVSGEYLEIEPHSRLAFTWAWGGTPDRISQVTIDFSGDDDETRLTLKHSQFFNEEARDGHNKGWEACLQHLPGYLAKTARGSTA